MEPTPIIEVRHLTAGYGERVILDDISVDIGEQEITVVLGGSGCGKTTFLKNLVRLQQPLAGSIRLFGQDITRLDESDFNQLLTRVGMLFQNGALLNSITVAENVAIPLEQHTTLSAEVIAQLVRVKLHLVNLADAGERLPSELSGGMKKRAALARAIALDPQILFCDEPSAGLDPVTSATLDQLILKLRHQLRMSIVIVTHELASIHRIADRIIFLENGQMIFHGTLNEAKTCSLPAVQHFFEMGSF